MSILNYGEESVSLAIEEIKPQDWTVKVYKPDVQESGTDSTRSPDMSRRIMNSSTSKGQLQ
jgi:hypothetical protein